MFDVMLKDARHPKTPVEALRLEHPGMYGRPVGAF